MSHSVSISLCKSVFLCEHHACCMNAKVHTHTRTQTRWHYRIESTHAQTYSQTDKHKLNYPKNLAANQINTDETITGVFRTFLRFSIRSKVRQQIHVLLSHCSRLFEDNHTLCLVKNSIFYHYSLLHEKQRIELC